jgi:hypothetical protein
MNKHLLYSVLISLVLIGLYSWFVVNLMKKPRKVFNNYVLDLPEEISQANDGDTLYCIKRNDTLFIQFK